MKNQNLSELSITELIESEKKLKSIVNIMIAVLVISPFLMILMLFQKQYPSALALLVLSILNPLFFLRNSKKQLNNIKSEIEKRSK